MTEISAIVHLRYTPGKIRTLEREIDQDRKKIQRIRHDLLHEQVQRRRMEHEIRMLTARIDRNMGKISRLKLEGMQERQKFMEAIS